MSPDTKQGLLTHEATTTEFARLNRIQPPSLLNHISKRGSYYGVKPRKLVNGRLVWPAIVVDGKAGQK